MERMTGAFSETLQSITNTKLKELSKKRAVFEEQKSALLTAISVETDQRSRIRKLLDGVKQCLSIRTDPRGNIISGPVLDNRLQVKLKNLERFLQQADYDPSISTKLLKDWEQSLIQQMNIHGLKYQYATLYGELVTEWLSAEKRETPALTDNNSEQSKIFEQAMRNEKLEQRLQWESSVFNPYETDQGATESFLQSLFGKEVNKQAFEALEHLRKRVESFECSLAAPNQFTETVLKWTIQGLLDSDLLSNEKRTVLKDFIGNPVILSEIADVLNMRMVDLQTWGWDGDIPVDQRRNINGKYRVYMHEDLLQAIFLQFIGLKWSVFFKRALNEFYHFDGAWAPRQKPIPKLDRMRREFFLGRQSLTPSVQTKREILYKSKYFMSKLLDSETQTISTKDGDEEADATLSAQAMPQQFHVARSSCMPMAPQVDFRGSYSGSRKMAKNILNEMADVEADEVDLFNSPNDTGPTTKNPMADKQLLLHLLSTEILINTHIHGEFTCVRSEFENWGQNLPHSTISLILSFFGVSKKWLSFFSTFLQAPLKFTQEQDGSSGQSKIRRRGVPESHVLSDVFGEVVLFCMDYSVNQATEGGTLFRIHNDFWFWSPSHQTCIKAWTAIETFAQTIGVALDEERTGSRRILRDKEELPTIDPSLPEGDVRWGFLYLDGASGRFMIDQSMVDAHTEELRRQLEDKKKSVFSSIQAWNAYAGTFFTTNFGKPANCYGQQHVDMMLETLQRIQRSIFTNDGGVAEFLKTTIRERFGISDIPDGYIYFPTDLGGLELQSPFIPLLQIRNGISENPVKTIAVDLVEAEEKAYRKAKDVWDNRTPGRRNYVQEDPTFIPDDPDTFMPFEEFIRYREEYECGYSGNLYEVMEELLKQPSEESVDVSHHSYENTALDLLGSVSNGLGTWYSMTPYWRWVAQVYGPDMLERFGGLAIVDRGLLPIGMVNLFRSGRVQWQG